MQLLSFLCFHNQSPVLGVDPDYQFFAACEREGRVAGDLLTHIDERSAGFTLQEAPFAFQGHGSTPWSLTLDLAGVCDWTQ